MILEFDIANVNFEVLVAAALLLPLPGANRRAFSSLWTGRTDPFNSDGKDSNDVHHRRLL
jgi:hypothetical protein